MMKYVRLCSISMVCGVLILAFAGCEDSSANSRAKTEKLLNELTSEMHLALAGSLSSPDEETQSKLNNIVSRLSSVNEAEPAQRAAKAMLTASALRELAGVRSTEIARMEAAQRAQRPNIGATLDAILRLDAVATGYQQRSDAAARQQLQVAAQSAQQTVQALSAQIAQVSSPIAEHTNFKQEQSQRVAQLREEVSQLLRNVQELGYSRGFETFKRAKATSRQADRIEYDIAQREIELDFELVPEHETADLLKTQLEEMIDAVNQAQADIAKAEQASAADVANTRRRISELATQITSGLDELRKGRAGADGTAGLDDAYTEAIDLLDKAIAQAQIAQTSGRGGEAAQAAQMLLARLHEARGHQFLSKAGGLEAHATLLAHLNQHSRLLNNPKLPEELKSAQEAAAQARQAAKDSYAQAQQEAMNLHGDPAVDQFKQALEAVAVIADGRAPASTASAIPSGRLSGGADTPQALVDAINQTAQAGNALGFFELTVPIEAIPNATPAMREIKTAMGSMLAGITQLNEALKRKFGSGVQDLDDLSMPTIASATLGSVQNDRASIQVTLSDGMKQTLTASEIQGRWYLGTTDDVTGGLFGEGPGSQSSPAGLPANDPSMQRMADMMLQAMSQMFAAMGDMMIKFAKQVDAGEFSSFEEAKAKFEEAMQQNMMQGGGMNLGF